MSQPSPSSELVLDVEGLSIGVVRGGLSVLDDVALRVRAGEVTGIVGESGSGKSTLALATLGHLRSGLARTAGSVKIAGTDVWGLEGPALQSFRATQVAFVPQDPATALNPALRVGTQMDELVDAMKASGREVTSVDDVIAGTGLPAWSQLRRRYPHEMSGGQQQRLTIAMAFVRQPRLIVFDEPTTGLDVSTQRRILETIRELCEASGVAATYISHDVASVRALVDQMVVLYAGRVVESGQASSVFSVPSHPYTQRLFAAVPDLSDDELPPGIPGNPPAPGRRPAGCTFHTRCSYVQDACLGDEPTLVSIGAERSVDHLVRCIAPLAPEQASERLHAAPVRATPTDHEGEALVVEGLTASYGKRQILHGVTLTVPAGRCVAVVGESGSGKTTLARSLVGLHEWDGGTVSLGGDPVPVGLKGRSRAMVANLQYVFQNPYGSLNPRRPISKLLEQPLRLLRPDIGRKERDARVEEMLAAVSLPDSYADRYVASLSGGERQRVAIARSLITEPSLLVCDEVTSALDVSVQASLVEMLERLRIERGVSLLFITHNLALVRSFAQEVVMLADGVIAESGPVAEVLLNPTTEHTRRLLDDLPKLRDPEPYDRTPASAGS